MRINIHAMYAQQMHHQQPPTARTAVHMLYCLQLKYNVDVVCEYITKKIPVPVRWVLVIDMYVKQQ